MRVMQAPGVELHVHGVGDGSLLRVESWCTTCGQRVTERTVDLSAIGSREAYLRNLEAWAGEDVQAFNAHQTACARRN